MKWKKKIQKSMAILCAGVLSVPLGSAGAMAECQEQTEECNPVKYSEMWEYPYYEGVLADTAANYSDGPEGGPSIALYDIDQDGTRELIVAYGTCMADWTNDVYTLEEGNLVTMIGGLAGYLLFYSAPDGNGIYTLYGKQGYQDIERVTKEGNTLSETTIESRELGQDEDYASFDNPIELTSLSCPAYDVQINASDGGVNLREGPGVKYDKVREDMVPTGAVVTIIRESTAENGVLWGYTYYDHCYGWITLTPVIRVE